MTIRRDKVLIVDVESTCWEGKPPPGAISEIIEIGLCVFDMATQQPESKRSIFVRPTQSTISPFCTQLTSITPEMVAERGIYFGEACAILQAEYASQNRLWLSWGNYDRTMFTNQCAARGVPYPFSDRHCNLKVLFGDTRLGGRKAGMAGALKILNIPLEGTHHRGDDDAWNIGRILAWMLQTYGKDVLINHW
jgi:inhibitor of KinA sporulation pathway (predicted exonuclease)